MPKISTDRDIHLGPDEAAIVFRDGLQLDFITGTGEIVKEDSPTFIMVVVGALLNEENYPILLELRRRTTDSLNARCEAREATESLISRAQENPDA